VALQMQRRRQEQECGNHEVKDGLV
jgi:hypothetical protein